jgi:hypothetical protein
VKKKMPLTHSKKPEAMKVEAIEVEPKEAPEEVSAEEPADDEIQDMLGKELMSALESKDHKKLMQGIEACVLSCLNKKED